MGYKLGGGYGVIPAEVKDKVLRLQFGTAIKEIPVSIGEFVFPKQCNFVSNSEICCYLENEDYRFVMWRNGVVNVVNLQNGILRGQIRVDDWDKAFGKVYARPMGGYKETTFGEIIPVWMAYAEEAGDNVLFFSEKMPVTLSMQVSPEMRQQLQEEAGEALWSAFTRMQDGEYCFRNRRLTPVLRLKGEKHEGKSFMLV